MDWRAQWIWADGEASPRNAWRCFRRAFEAPLGWDGARLAITADSRYVLYLNGVRLGRGPARSWPFLQSFDLYEVGHLLKPGRANVLAVLVMHYGVSTFQSWRGRGGLLAQLELTQAAKVTTVVTDSSWKSALHAGHDPRSPRMSVQLGFAERVDARLWDEAWQGPDYDDSAWARAEAIGPVGTPPWTELTLRDIPLLSEEALYPSRVASLRAVKPLATTATIDICAQMMPDSVNHSNAVRYAGYLATVLRLPQSARLTLGSALATTSVFGRCFVNGAPIDPTRWTGTDPERYLTLELDAGDTLLLIETTGDDRSGVGLHLGIDSEEAFELVSPLGEGSSSPFVTLGPFDELMVIDHQPSRALVSDHPAYRQAAAACSSEELLALREWLRPVPTSLVSQDDVFTACVWTRDGRSLPVPASLQGAVSAGGALTALPRFDGADSELILDFGRETSGYLDFELEAAAGTVIDLYGFEYLEGDWRQDTHGLDNTLRYVCREGRQRYTSAVRRGLRYLMVVVREARRPVQVSYIRMLESSYPVAEVGQFACSDALLNDIWAMSRLTLLLCMEDTYVDCPAYEQTFWVGDARNAALVNAYVFGADTLTERCLRLVPPSKVHSPLYADQVPSGWNSVIPNWTFFWVTACLEHYGRTGDRAFATEMWPHVRFTLEHYLDKLDARGLLYSYGWNFLDWAPIDQPQDGVVAHQTMFLVKALHAAAALAGAAGDEQGGSALARAAARLKDAVNTHLWSNQHQAYLDCIHGSGALSTVFSMQTQVVAYLCDVAEGERKARLERYLVNPPGDFVPIGSPFMSFFYFEALTKLGRVGLMIDDIRANYGRMLEHGATTCWEMYPGEANRANPKLLTRSHCHAWSAAPGYFLGAYVLGVRPTAPGWREVLVAPQPCGLSWARGSVPLPGKGTVEVVWKFDAKGTMQLTVRAPQGLELDVRLPDEVKGEVSVTRLGDGRA